MDTPIVDFVKTYSRQNNVRAHMPGHKGLGFLSVEKYDITEIDGADVLYNSHGIIEQSRQNAQKLFDTKMTLYSCEGSSLSIKAMLYLAVLYSNDDSLIEKADEQFLFSLTFGKDKPVRKPLIIKTVE